MSGRPRIEREEPTLQDERWTRENVRGVIVTHVRTPEQLTAAQAQLIGRTNTLFRKFEPDYEPERARYRAVIGDWKAGYAAEQIASDRVLQKADVERMISAQKRYEIIAWYLTSYDGQALIRICDENKISVQGGYKVIERFVYFVSAEYAREALRSGCTHGDKGGTGKCSGIDRSKFMASQCTCTIILGAFDRYGRLQVDVAQIDRSQQSYLQGLGVRLEPVAA